MYKIAKEFFEEFVSKYNINEGNITNTYYYKYRHTYDVVNMMEKITTNLSEEKKDILKTIAIFHDLGRFVQLERYSVYDDVESHFDHALESVKVLEENKFFENNNIAEDLKKKMCDAIFYHNKLSISGCRKDSLEYAKYIRDADKLGILLRVGEGESLGAISTGVLASFSKEQLVSYDILESRIDGLLAELAFIFDLNYDTSQRILIEEGILDNRLKIFENQKEYASIEKTINKYKQNVQNKILVSSQNN